MGDLEKAKREIRYVKSAADDRRWDLVDSRIRGIEAALEGVSDAESAPILAEIEPLRELMATALRAEQAGRVEREIRRSLSAADEGSESHLTKAIDRLAASDAQECLTPEVIQRLQDEIAAVQSKLGIAPTAPPVATIAPPTAAAPVAQPLSAPAAPAPAPPTTATPALSDEARAIESDVSRLLRFAAEDVEREPEQAESRIERAVARLESDAAKLHLPPEMLARLAAEVKQLQAGIETARQTGQIAQIEEQISRFTRQAESDCAHNPRSAERMLQSARQRIDAQDARRLLPAPTMQRLRSEIASLHTRIAAVLRDSALERALPILQELEQRVAGRIFDDSQPAYRVLGDLDHEKSRVRGAIAELQTDDAQLRAIEARLATVDERIADASAALDAGQARERVIQAWRLELDAIAGWEDERHAGGTLTEMPKSALAVRRLRHFLADGELARIRAAHGSDTTLQAAFAEAERIRDTAAANLDTAFTAILSTLESGQRPASRIDLEVPGRLAAQARSDLEGTRYAESIALRASVLDQRWQAELEADRAAREARYRELSAVADAAWPAIAAAVTAEDGFDPVESQSRGKTVRFHGIRNRIGWDFSGPYDFAMWVNGTPVVGNYEKHVSAAVDSACERTGLPLDDHTDWDVVFVVGGPGTIKQRFQVMVRDRNMRELGTIEEWRPVDCVMCSVTALHAGPVAAGPER